MPSTRVDILFNTITEATNSLSYVIELESRLIAETKIPHTYDAQRIALIKTMAKSIKTHMFDLKTAINTIVNNINKGKHSIKNSCRVLFIPLIELRSGKNDVLIICYYVIS